MTDIITGENSCINIVLNDDDNTHMSVPLTPDNIHYAEIKRQVVAGELTIADAD